jgi:hypothetical protein
VQCNAARPDGRVDRKRCAANALAASGKIGKPLPSPLAARRHARVDEPLIDHIDKNRFGVNTT